MMIFLFVLPILAILSALFIYRHNGKREILKFDLVQFVYAFVLVPMIFVWLKTFVFILFRHELNLRLSVSELFVFDTVFSTLFLFIGLFVVIHSLTKSFELKRSRDPLYDIFAHSEFFHQFISHVAIYAGAIVLAGAMAFANLLIPIQVSTSISMLTLVITGVVFGVVGFAAIWNYETPDPLFMRVMKLIIAVLFIFLGSMYFVFDPPFALTHSVYWLVTSINLTLVALALVAERPEKNQAGLMALPFNLNWKKSIYYWRFVRKQVAKLKRV